MSRNIRLVILIAILTFSNSVFAQRGFVGFCGLSQACIAYGDWFDSQIKEEHMSQGLPAPKEDELFKGFLTNILSAKIHKSCLSTTGKIQSNCAYYIQSDEIFTLSLFSNGKIEKVKELFNCLGEDMGDGIWRLHNPNEIGNWPAKCSALKKIGTFTSDFSLGHGLSRMESSMKWCQGVPKPSVELGRVPASDKERTIVCKLGEACCERLKGLMAPTEESSPVLNNNQGDSTTK